MLPNANRWPYLGAKLICNSSLRHYCQLSACDAGPGWRDMDRLTHLPLEKMATILADDIFKCIFLNENDKIQIQISLKLVPRSPIDNKPALVQVMAWRWTGDEPLPEPMMTQFTDTYIYSTRGDQLSHTMLDKTSLNCSWPHDLSKS